MKAWQLALLCVSPAALSAHAAPRQLRARQDVASLCSQVVPQPHRQELDGKKALLLEQRRLAALAREYEVRLPSSSLILSAFDRERGSIGLASASPLLALDGLVHLWLSDSATLTTLVSEETAKAMEAARARSTLLLTLVFRMPEDDEMLSCYPMEGAMGYTLGAQPLRWRFHDGRGLLAQGIPGL